MRKSIYKGGKLMLKYIITWAVGLFILHIPYLIAEIFGKEVEEDDEFTE